ncbi:imidazole glycerol phosphate synthase subunit HisH [Cryomorphaceae bacterium]|nr:imidazole glycerol phosphate synthase subunit HisH [Cryomorphaceae bacterium]
MITIVDYGMGNLGSLRNMFKRLKTPVTIESDPDVVLRASKILLPGVGAFDSAMKRINESGLREALLESVVTQNTPILGICLGMQLLVEGSEEGNLEGLGFIKGYVRRFKFQDNSLKIPHMGWNEVSDYGGTQLFKGLNELTLEEENPRFYFVHSYHVELSNDEDVAFKTEYGHEFNSALKRGHVLGAQFHPEKSHKFGMQFLRNFIEYEGA